MRAGCFSYAYPDVEDEIADLFDSPGISALPPGAASASALLAQQLKGMIVSDVALFPHIMPHTC